MYTKSNRCLTVVRQLVFIVCFCPLWANSSDSTEYKTEAIIDNLTGSEGESFARDLLKRRKDNGEQFSMPELADAVNNMHTALRKLDLLNMSADDATVLIEMHKLLDDLKTSSYPYRTTVEILFKATLLRDYFYDDFYQITQQTVSSTYYSKESPHVHTVDNLLTRISPEIDMQKLSYIAFPDDWTARDVLISKDDVVSGGGFDQLSRMLDREDIILLPEFNNLSLDDFIRIAPYSILPQGLCQEAFCKADGIYQTPMIFWFHDLVHSADAPLRIGKQWNICKTKLIFDSSSYSNLSFDDGFSTLCTDKITCNKNVLNSIYFNANYSYLIKHEKFKKFKTTLKLLLFTLLHELDSCSAVGIMNMEALDFLKAIDVTSEVLQNNVSVDEIGGESLTRRDYYAAVFWIENVKRLLIDNKMTGLSPEDYSELIRNLLLYL